VCIDPMPRTEVAAFADRMERRPIESVDLAELEAMLPAGSVLIIDSSHVLQAGGDLWYLYFKLLPLLPHGLVRHVHDILLPYEYPRSWVVNYGWNEQYLVQAMLQYGGKFEVLWAGHYLQKTRSDFSSYFAHTESGAATSLWLRIVAE